MKKIIMHIFKIISNFKLKYRGMYIINSGDLAGSFFVYIREEDIEDSRAILMMPYPLKPVFVRDIDMKNDIKDNNIEFVQKLPKEVYDVCRANFIYYAKKEGIFSKEKIIDN